MAKLEIEEWVFLEEYCKIMQSLAISFDKLQSEKKCFLSFVAPTILMLGQLLIHSLTEVKYCKPLSIAIISSLEKRFPHIFDLNTPEINKDFIIASISKSKFKLNWVPVRYTDMCSKLFVDEYKIFISNQSDYPSINIEDEESNKVDKDLYSSFNKQNNLATSSNIISDTLNSNESTQLNLIIN